MSLENTAEELDGEDEFVDELKPGTQLMLGQYTIEDFLAAGGFGITYLARDSLDRRVVIKECFPGSFCRRQNMSVTPRSRAHQNELRSIVRLFSQEAMALAKAKHPNIVGVYQVFEENNTAYMALDYVQGRDLLEILQDSPESLKPDMVEGYLRKILDAIKHVHDMDMLHRDISPDNIIINEDGEPILIDFGAARESTNERVTRMLSALRVVKDGYSPQEFYIAGSEQTPSCDLYSLAASFYHIITGELPPDSQWRLSSCAAGDDDPYVSLGEKTSDYSKRFVSGLDKAMSVLPRDRMQSAQEWLDHISDAPPVAEVEPPKREEPVAAKAEKKSLMPMLLGSTAVAAAAGVGFFMMNAETSSTQSDAGTEIATTAAPAAPAATDTAVAPAETTDTPVLAETSPVTVPFTAAPSDPAIADEAPEIAAVEEPTTPIVPAAPLPTVEADTPAIAATEEVVLPELPEVGEVATAVTEPTAPAAEEETDFDVPPILAALPPTLAAPAQRPLRELEVASVALTDASPVVDTVAPVAPEPAPEEVVVAEEPEAPVAEEPAEEVVAAIDETPPAEAAEDGASSTLDFFVAMNKSQPALTAQSRRSTANATTRSLARTGPSVAEVPAPATADVATDTQQSAFEVIAPPGATASAEPREEPSITASEVSTITTRDVPALPFTLSILEPGLIVGVSDDAPAWMTRNTRIVSINGTAVSTNAEIRELVEATSPGDGANTVDIWVGVDSGLSSAVLERALSVPIEQHTFLLNGLHFATRDTGAGWETEVIEAPASSSFQVGDTLVAFAATMEPIDGPNSLTAVLERELAEGTTSFSFAVRRDGEIWLEAFNLASLAD